MRYWFVIWALVCSLYVWGEQLSAEVATYNSATMVNIPCEEAWVSFSNSSHSKGDVRKGDTAIWKIGGLPACQVSEITLTISSNTSSGAGEIDLFLHGTTYILEQGPYSKWKGTGNWSKLGLPISFDGIWNMADNDTLQLYIIGTENSIHVSRLDITYSSGPPIPHTVTLQWQTNDGAVHTQTITERAVGAGVDLPRRDPSLVNREPWCFLGWTTDANPSSHTHYERPGTIYYPKNDITFYALYEDMDEQIDIHQDTAHISGEYIIAAWWLDELRMLYGSTKNGLIHTKPISVSQSNGMYTLAQAYADSAARFQVTFHEDSLTIRQIQTLLPLGYANNKLTNKLTYWAWETKNMNSICIFTPVTTKSGANYLLWLKLANEQDIVGYIGSFLRSSMDVGWILFPVSNLPYTPSETLWTTHPYLQSELQSAIHTKHPSCKKYFVNGQLRIIINNRIYSAQGQLVRQ